MADLPPQYEEVMKAIEAYRVAHSQQKLPPEVLKMVYKEILKQYGAGKNPDVSSSMFLYTAENLMRVIAHVQAIAKAFPPTHRKGVGKDGGVSKTAQEPWIFPYAGGPGGGGTSGGDSGDEGDLGDLNDGIFDWAPAGEVSRAQAVLREVYDEMHMGFGDDPLPFVHEVVRRLGGRWGLNGKRGNASDPSKDILAWNIPGFAPQLFDVLVDAGGDNKLSWQPLRYSTAAVWIAP